MGLAMVHVAMHRPHLSGEHMAVRKHRSRIALATASFDAEFNLQKGLTPSICREAGIEGLHFHDLRATYVTRILEAGYDSFTARDAAGHLDIRTTGIYARPSIERVMKAVDSLSETAQLQVGKSSGANNSND